MRLRTEQADDRPAVRSVVTDAFGPDEGPLIADLVDALPGRIHRRRRRRFRLRAYEPWMTGTLVYGQTFWTYDCVGLRDPEA